MGWIVSAKKNWVLIIYKPAIYFTNRQFYCYLYRSLYISPASKATVIPLTAHCSSSSPLAPLTPTAPNTKPSLVLTTTPAPPANKRDGVFKWNDGKCMNTVWIRWIHC